MSDTEDDEDQFEALGVQAFQDMARAMDRLGTTLQAYQNQVAVQAKAAAQGLQASQMALQASQEALQASKTEFRSVTLFTGFGALALILVASGLGYSLGQSSGWDQGHAAGYASARSEVAASSWANTPSGHRALELDRLGSLGKLVGCDQPGWRISVQDGDRVCFVDHAPDGKLYGWTVP